MTDISSTCIYTIRNSDDLHAAMKEKQFPFTEGREWKTGVKILKDAEACGQRVAVLFSDAAYDTSKLIFAALLRTVVLHDGSTTVTVEQLRPIRGRATCEVIVKSTGQPIKKSDIRPYRICETPDFVTRLKWEGR